MLNGTSFGFDFNPVSDRIRVVSNLGQNLRLNADTGAVGSVDTDLNFGTAAAQGAAYANNVPGSTATTLYVIDATTDALYVQNPPNNGTTILVGPLTVNTSALVGFDISRSGVAYASLEIGGVASLATINLSTGAASVIGAFPAPVSGIAVSPIPAGCSLDIDGNDTIDPLTDGLLVLRAMFGLTGTAATAGAIGLGAARTDWPQLRAFMNGNCGTSLAP